MAQIDQGRMNRIKTRFNELFVDPLVSNPDSLDKTIVEFYSTEAEAGAREQGGVASVKDMVDKVASKLTKYKNLYTAFQTIQLNVDDRNLGANTFPFQGDAGKNRFKELVSCCYANPTVKDCSRYIASPGYYAVYEKKAPDDACIEVIVREIINSFPVPQDPECQAYADKFAEQQRQAAQAGGRRVKTRTRRRSNRSRRY